MTFQEAVATVLRKKYATFSGRAGRAEFWWFSLFAALALGCFLGLEVLVFWALLAAGVVESAPYPEAAVGLVTALAYLPGVVLFLPGTAVAVRRLHDTGRSGWWCLLLLLLPGLIALAVMWAQPTGPDNRYGPGAGLARGPVGWGAPPPAWYPDPGEPGVLRYWDGVHWTEFRHPAWDAPAAGAQVPAAGRSIRDR